MGPLDALWHLMNFLAPAVGVSVMTCLLAKAIWRRELRAVPLRPLLLWSGGAGAVVLLVGLLVFGRDGRMATYGALVVSTATVLWWKGFRPLR